MYLLDTCILEYVQRPEADAIRKRVVAWIEKQNETDLYISVVTIVEKAQGAQKNRKDAQKLTKVSDEPKKKKKMNEAKKTDAYIAGLVAEWGTRILSIEVSAAQHWGVMRGEKMTENLDAAIAAVAKAHRYKVVTANEKDFNQRGVELVNPLKL